jgi:hypothetical protein
MFSLQIKMAGVCKEKPSITQSLFGTTCAKYKIMMTRRSLTEQKKLKINNAVMANSRKKKGKGRRKR